MPVGSSNTACVGSPCPRPKAAVVTKILASQRAVTVGVLLGEVRRSLKRQPRVVLAASPLSGSQRHDLRLRSVVWSDLDEYPLTSLPAGIHAVAADLQRTFGLSGPSALIQTA